MTLQTVRHGELSKYNPDKGLKVLAVAEAAEKYFARAKDAKGLERAIRAKLEAQAEFVFWWDTQAQKAERGQPKKNSGSTAGIHLGQNGLPEEFVVRRWRSRLNDPAKFEATFETACAKYSTLLEFQKTAHVGQSTGEQEWYTPAPFIEAARVVLGDIDLDPASHDDANAVVKAGQIFTADDSGLEQQWDGRVWMNPPYAQPLIARFCEKLAASVRANTVTAAIVLVNNATETQWFRSVADVAAAICFPAGRIRFWSPTKDSASPLQGQAVIYIGADIARFCETFAPFGFCVEVRR